jgi:hypothetical protein
VVPPSGNLWVADGSFGSGLPGLGCDQVRGDLSWAEFRQRPGPPQP